MAHTTAAATRQLTLVELDDEDTPRGPTVHWPYDWPSARDIIDLSAATLDQALNAWREWVTGADSTLLVDVTPRGDDPEVGRIVQIGGRRWLASMSDPLGLSADVVTYLRMRGVDPAGYVAHWAGPGRRWAGDVCGCVDDRCVGHHHDPSDPCGCLPAWVDDYLSRDHGPDAVAAALVDAADALDRVPSPATTVPGERPARPGERCSCGRPAVTVYLTERFGDVPFCGCVSGVR